MQKSGLNRSQLAEASGVTNYFLRKLFDPGCTKLEINEIYKLTQFISGKQSFKDYYQNAPEALKELLNVLIPVNLKTANKNTRIFDHNLCKHSYIILMLASMNNGVTKNQLISLLSISCISLIDKLLAANLLVEKNKRLFFDDFKPINRKKVIEVYKELSNFYNPTADKIASQYIFYAYQSLSVDAINKLIKRFQAFHLEVETFIDAPENQGPIPYFAQGMTSCFTPNWDDFETYE